MKHKFTKLMAMVAILLMGAWSINAASYIPTVTKTFTANTTVYCTDADITGAPTSPNATSWVVIPALGTASLTYTNTNGDANGNPTSITDNLPTTPSSVNMIQIKADGGVYNSSKRVIHMRVTGITGFIAHGNTTSSGRGMQVSANVASGLTETSTMNVVATVTRNNNSGSFITAYNSLSASETYVLSIYAVSGDTRFYAIEFIAPPAAPSITKFVAEGVEATINESAKTITAELPYGTNLASIEPVVTIGGTATSYGPPGAQDFSNSVTVPVVYTVSDGVNEVDYSVTLTASQTPSSEKDLSNVMIGGKTPTFDAGTNTYSITLPKAYDITSQAVTFTKPGTATANFTSGATHDFTNPLQITVTAQDASTKVYTLTAAVGNKNIAYIINTAVSANDTKIRPELAKTNYIENILIGTVTTSTDFSMYDLVILTESPSSGSTGMKALWGINKPLLALKIFALNANTWDKGTQASPAAPASTTATVYEPNHPIFSGISLTGALNNEIVSIGAITTGNGLQTSNYSGNYLIGGVGTSPAIIEFPINTPAGATASGYKNQNLIEKLLVLGISDNNQDKLTTDGLKLVTNAVNYLTGSTTWGINAGNDFQSISFTGNAPVVGLTSATIAWQAVPAAVKYVVTQVTPSGVKGVSTVKSAINVDVPGNETSLDLTGLSGSTSYQFNVAAENAIGKLTDPAIITFSTWFTGVSSATLEGVNFDGRTIQNPDRQQLHVFDATGRLLLTSREDINMSAQAKGVYLVKGESGMMKIAVTK